MTVRSSLRKSKLAQGLLWAARRPFFRPLVTLLFKFMTPILFTGRCFENAHWVAFHHPQPDDPLHILILPKKSLPSLMAASLESNLNLDLTKAVQALSADYHPEACGYRMITNGWANQTIPQWHWHLISDNPGDTND